MQTAPRRSQGIFMSFCGGTVPLRHARCELKAMIPSCWALRLGPGLKLPHTGLLVTRQPHSACDIPDTRHVSLSVIPLTLRVKRSVYHYQAPRKSSSAGSVSPLVATSCGRSLTKQNQQNEVHLKIGRTTMVDIEPGFRSLGYFCPCGCFLGLTIHIKRGK